jgi:hypothetical protein
MKINEEYNLSLYLLLPLLSSDETSAETYLEGYSHALINAFSYDINKPYLDNHVHLVFDNSMYREKDVPTIVKSSFLDHISHYRISGVFVKSYAMRLSEEYQLSIKLILDNKVSELPYAVKIKIFKFWDLNANSNLFKILFENEPLKSDISKEILIEEDYIDLDAELITTNFSLRNDW